MGRYESQFDPVRLPFHLEHYNEFLLVVLLNPPLRVEAQAQILKFFLANLREQQVENHVLRYQRSHIGSPSWK